MDPLSAILESMHASAALAMTFRMSSPFAIEKSEVAGIPFRVAEGAPYWLKVGNTDWARVEPGDLVLIPHGDRHVMASDKSLQTMSVADEFSRLGLEEWRAPGRDRFLPRVIELGGPGELSTIVGGILVFRDAARSPLLESLPPLIHIRASGHPMLARLGGALQALLDEAKEGAPGWSIAVCRLAEVIFVQALRAHFSLSGQASNGWYEALGDPKIGNALVLIHRDLSVNWSVEALAVQIGMSRSRFAARFTALLGKAPLEYQTHIRLTRAAELLAQGGSVSVVSAHAGYASEKAFSRAFRNWSGTSPGRYRRLKGEASLAESDQ